MYIVCQIYSFLFLFSCVCGCTSLQRSFSARWRPWVTFSLRPLLSTAELLALGWRHRPSAQPADGDTAHQGTLMHWYHWFENVRFFKYILAYRHISLYLCLNTCLLFCPPGVVPAWVLPGGSSGAGWGGVSGTCGRGRSRWWAAPLQAGVHRPGAGSSRPTGLLTNQQIPLPLH